MLCGEALYQGEFLLSHGQLEHPIKPEAVHRLLEVAVADYALYDEGSSKWSA